MKTSPWFEGTRRNKILLVGEAPSYEELRKGRPFCGPAGHRLDMALNAAGLPRAAVDICNLWQGRIRKTENPTRMYDENNNLVFDRSYVTPAGIEQATHLAELIANSNYNVVCPMGAPALHYLFGKSGITKYRGSILESIRFPTQKLVPTIHPAATLRGMYLWVHLIASDLKRVDAESKTPEINLPQHEMLLNPNLDEIKSFCDLVRDIGRFNCDIELYKKQISVLSVVPNQDIGLSIPFIGGDERGGRPYWTEEEEIEVWKLFASIWEDPEIEVLNQNLMFDAFVLGLRNRLLLRGPVHDPMVAHHIMYPDFPKSLAFTTSLWTRQPYYKDDGKLYNRLWEDLEGFHIYNLLDSFVSLEIFDSLVPLMKDQGYWQTYLDTMAMFYPFLTTTLAGQRLDEKGLAKLGRRIDRQLLVAKGRLSQEVGFDLNPNSPKQCCSYFYGTLGLKPYTGKSGNPTTDDKALQRIIRATNNRAARLIQLARKFSKLKSTYIEVRTDSDHRLRSMYNLRGTNTGRLSSSQTLFGTGLNGQNIDPALDDFLIPDDEPLMEWKDDIRI